MLPSEALSPVGLFTVASSFSRPAWFPATAWEMSSSLVPSQELLSFLAIFPPGTPQSTPNPKEKMIVWLPPAPDFSPPPILAVPSRQDASGGPECSLRAASAPLAFNLLSRAGFSTLRPIFGRANSRLFFSPLSCNLPSRLIPLLC